ncbi:hypothetical protein [Variovorax sp. JS1663]|uniref:hypothetical protein n=1 Tax=Variovorax sp. JS1663 TaxID=1851577 RepID=UPI000B347D1D|nr:hypothetical protein [Variovorax sp. JS1663]OUM01677.1 hypothetical protein A8M77_15500 [Variovorax sp. JS1663]
MYTRYPTHVLRDDGACIPLAEENADYRAFLAWVVDGNTPTLPPQPTHAQLWERAITEMRALRQPILDVLDGLQASANTLGLSERAAVIETAKQGLRDITKLNLTDCTTYAQMRAKVGAAYAALVASLPADIRQSFKEATA